MSRRAGSADGVTVRLRRAGAIAVVACFTAALAAVPATSSVAAAADPPGYTKTQTLTREHLEADGTTTKVDSRDVTVTVDHTQNLRGRERVTVSWSGAHPSAARATNPYGVGGLTQEYPVVILQCRGIDDPSLPLNKQLRPETCWTSVYGERFSNVGVGEAVWRHDRYAAAADTADPDPATWPAACDGLAPGTLATHLLPFVAASWTSYPSCSTQTSPPEAALDSALPPAEIAAYTALDGTGTVEFEVRTAAENQSLGCSSDVPCSLVVIPIMGISCADGDAECRKTGRYAPGSKLAEGTVDAAVAPNLWWSASNWRGRFSVPLTFGLPPDACKVLDSRAPVGVYGSELLAQASLQWAPAYCLRQARFKYQHNLMSESAALRLLATGGAVGALASEPAKPAVVGTAYAPVAVSGFAIAYVVDLPDNAGELSTMRLSPRLLAKLLTQSYPATNPGRAHPGLGANPLTLMTDPEFVELNPGQNQIEREAAATLLSLSVASDTMTALTEYIAADPDAMAFIGGEPDPWGMVVNPFYAGIDLPREEWPLLDTWVRPSQLACEKLIQTPYLTRVAAPVGTLRQIASAIIDGWPNVQTQCTRSVDTDPWKFGRLPRDPYGTRFMLGLVSLGDAERYGLQTAQLRTDGTGTGATFVSASEASMTAALAAASQSAPGEPFLIDQTRLTASAYPGTMIVHAVARLSGLAAADADHMAQLIRVATSEGQTPGSANGELPAGFVPIVATGPTAPLHASAQAVATAIDNQAGTMTPTPTPTPTSTPPTGATTTTPASRAPAGTTPGAATPNQVSGLPADEVPDDVPVLVLGETITEQSSVGQGALPALLGIGLAGLIAAPALRLLTTRRRMS